MLIPPAISKHHPDGVSPELQQLGDIKGAVKHRLVVAGECRVEDLIANTIAIDAKFAKA